MKVKRKKFASTFSLDYLENETNNFNQIFLLLHGFGQQAETIFNQVKNLIPSHAKIIAPNGPFPLIKKRHKELKYSFAWYFYNPFSQDFLIDYEVPSTLLKNFIEHLQYEKLPITIIGHSQGGYLAPFVGQKLKMTKQVIGINCRFREDMLEPKLTFRLDAISGLEDQVVDPQNALQSFESLQKKGVKGRFIGLKNHGHEVSELCLKSLKELIYES
jgi:predicted esterase